MLTNNYKKNEAVWVFHAASFFYFLFMFLIVVQTGFHVTDERL